MSKIVIDGVEFEVSEAVHAAFTKAEKAHADALAAGKVEADKATARADAAEQAKATADKAHADAADPKKFEAAVASRVALLAQAREVLGSEAKVDGDDMAIRVSVITKLDPDFKADGKSPDYIAARYDAALQFRAKAPTATRVDGKDGAPAANTGDRRVQFAEAVRKASEAKK